MDIRSCELPGSLNLRLSYVNDAIQLAGKVARWGAGVNVVLDSSG